MSNGHFSNADHQSSPLRFVLAGSVGSSRLILESLIRHGAHVAGVLELSPEAARNVSGYVRLKDVADGAGIPCVQFRNLNDPEIVETVRAWKPDLFFAVGLSQLVKPELLSLPRLGCVGYHPTWLPAGRGRAPLAWLTLDGTPGAATFFLMDEGADSGPILAQEPFYVSPHDYAEDVRARSRLAIETALDRWLPRLLAGEWDPQPQDDEQATYHGKRAPADGLIDWQGPAAEIHALIRATSRPHPGAYTYCRGQKLIVWRAECETRLPIKGVPGRVLDTDPQRGALVQTGEGLLWLTEVEWISNGDNQDGDKPLRVGMKLGFVVEDEIFRLSQQVSELQQRLAELAAERETGDVTGTGTLCSEDAAK